MAEGRERQRAEGSWRQNMAEGIGRQNTAEDEIRGLVPREPCAYDRTLREGHAEALSRCPASLRRDRARQ